MFYWRGGHRRLAEHGELYSKSGGNRAVIRKNFISSQNALSEKIGQGVFVVEAGVPPARTLTKTQPTRLPLQGVSGVLGRVHLTGHRPVATGGLERAFFLVRAFIWRERTPPRPIEPYRSL